MGVSKLKISQSELYPIQGSKEEKLQAIYDRWFDCARCGLSQFRSSRDLVFIDGNPDASVMFVGEAPGQEEDETGVPFVGRSGQLLNQMLAQFASEPEIVDLWKWYRRVVHNDKNNRIFHDKIFEWRYKHFFFANVIACRPPENRIPLAIEVKSCWERLHNVIYAADPDLIVALGKTAAEALIKKKIEVTKNRGKLFDVVIPGHVVPVTYPVLVTFHPSYLLRKADYATKGGDYELTMKDIQMAIQIGDFLRLHQRAETPPDRSAAWAPQL